MCRIFSLSEEAVPEMAKELAARFRLNEDSYLPFEFCDRNYEIHRNFIDVQFVRKGAEDIMIADESRFLSVPDFDEARDIAFFADKPWEDLTVHLRPGLFCVIFPGEAHLPCLKPALCRKASWVDKCVAKIPVLYFREHPLIFDELFATISRK